MTILMLVEERGNLPVFGENPDAHRAAAILREEPDSPRSKIFHKARGDSLAFWKFPRRRNHNPGIHSIQKRGVTGGSMPRRTFNQDVAGQFGKGIFHQPLLGVEARVRHEEDSRRTGAELDNEILVVGYPAQNIS